MAKEDSHCPICCEEYEAADRGFLPCDCGFALCTFCWNRIKETGNGRCPACRSPYSAEARFRDDTPTGHPATTPIIVAQKQPAAFPREAPAKALGRMPPAQAPASHALLARTRAHLREMCVVQRCVVRVENLSRGLAREQILCSGAFFSQYGKVTRVLIMPDDHEYGADVRLIPSRTAFISFSNEADARRAVLAADGFFLEGRCVRCSINAARYCPSWLRGEVVCPVGSACPHLHALGDPSLSLSANQSGLSHSPLTSLIHPGINLVNGNGVRGGMMTGATSGGAAAPPSAASCAASIAAARAASTVLPPLATSIPTTLLFPPQLPCIRKPAPLGNQPHSSMPQVPSTQIWGGTAHSSDALSVDAAQQSSLRSAAAPYIPSFVRAPVAPGAITAPPSIRVSPSEAHSPSTQLAPPFTPLVAPPQSLASSSDTLLSTLSKLQRLGLLPRGSAAQTTLQQLQSQSSQD